LHQSQCAHAFEKQLLLSLDDSTTEKNNNVSLSVITAIFPGEPGLAGFTEAKLIATAKPSPTTNQHPTFYRPDAVPVAQPTVSEH